MGGRDLRLPGTLADAPGDPPTPGQPGSVEALYRLRAIWDHACERTAAAQSRSKSRLDAKRTEPVAFQPGDEVIVALPPGVANKIEWAYTGPYRVKAALGGGQL